jgi:hypothetical protein
MYYHFCRIQQTNKMTRAFISPGAKHGMVGRVIAPVGRRMPVPPKK